jgi:hypothetical protein
VSAYWSRNPEFVLRSDCNCFMMPRKSSGQNKIRGPQKGAADLVEPEAKDYCPASTFGVISPM